MIDQNEPQTTPLRRVRTRSGRRRAAVAVVAVLLAATAWWATGGAGDDPEAVAADFATALADGDELAAGALTDAPQAAASTISAVRIGLGPRAGVQARVLRVAETSEPPGQRRASLALSWELGEGRAWEYETSVPLERADAGWRIRWSPAVLHPSLGPDDRIELRGLAPRAPRVLDGAGAVLMSEQTVTGVVIAVPAPDEDLRAVAAALAPLDVGVSGERLVADARDLGRGALLAVSLREEPLARVRDRLEGIAGVSLRPERRLITADGVRSPALVPALTEGAATRVERGWQVARVDAEGRLVEQMLGVGPGEPTDVVVTLDRSRQLSAQRAVDGVDGAAMLVAVLPCPGTENIEGRQIPNDDGFDLGSVPLHTAFARSCNTTFARLGVGLGPTVLGDTAASLGLGVDWSVPGLPAVTGEVPAARTPAERVEASIGQGRVVASPFGMALLAAGIAAGTPPAPTFVAGNPGTVTGAAAPDGISDALRDDLAAMMRETVTSGSASQLAGVPELGGKTGTAQFGDGTRSHGWFIGTVGQDMAFAVLTTDSGTSRPAVDAAGVFLEQGGR